MSYSFIDELKEGYIPIMRLVNDAKKFLKKKYPGKDLKYLKFNDYDLSKEKVIQYPCKYEGYNIYVVERNDGVFFDVY